MGLSCVEANGYIERQRENFSDLCCGLLYQYYYIGIFRFLQLLVVWA